MVNVPGGCHHAVLESVQSGAGTSHEERSASPAERGSVVKETVMVSHAAEGHEAQLGDVQRTLQRPLVQGFHISQGYPEPDGGWYPAFGQCSHDIRVVRAG